MPERWWPQEVQARHDFFLYTVRQDAWIFRNRSDGIYFAVGGIDPLGITTILMEADVVKFTSVRTLGLKMNIAGDYYRD